MRKLFVFLPGVDDLCSDLPALLQGGHELVRLRPAGEHGGAPHLPHLSHLPQLAPAPGIGGERGTPGQQQRVAGGVRGHVEHTREVDQERGHVRGHVCSVLSVRLSPGPHQAVAADGHTVQLRPPLLRLVTLEMSQGCLMSECCE